MNELLDNMVTASGVEGQVVVFRELVKISNADEIKWITRIILKDLKLNLKADTILNTFHPDGNEYYNLTNSIKDVCVKF